jgi:glycosyltransferase involved in cell wall biosynthesis
MNILFLTLVGSDDINERGIYNDLMWTFDKHGHKLFVVSPRERKYVLKTKLFKRSNINNLRVRTLNIQKTNFFEKGISTLILEYIFLFSILKYFRSIKFDLIIYSTPPITFTNIIKFLKNRDNAQTYLLLKDIFPQNAVDMRLIKDGGLVHRYFKRQERKLYQVSNFIGCMSPANVKYMELHSPYLKKNRIEENPNSLKPITNKISSANKATIRKKFGIPEDVTVFIYGGNLGVPQGLEHLIATIDFNLDQENIFFVIVGSGTRYSTLLSWFELNSPSNAILLPSLEKFEYDSLVKSCDVGLIFLDRQFTIPNYPSRILAYMEARIPILMAIDEVSDIGTIAQKNGYGFWSLNGDTESFNKQIMVLFNDLQLRKKMGSNGFNYMLKHYTVDRSFDIIMRHFPSV